MTDPTAATPAPLEPSDTRFRTITAHASQVVTLVADDGAVLWVSPPVERLLGYAPQELIGQNGLRFVAPEDIEMVTATVTELLRRPGETAVVEHGAIHQDGTRRWLETTVTNALEEPGMEALVIVSNVRDIRQRRRTEDELRFQTALLQAQGEASLDGILVVALNGEVLSFNRRFVELWDISEEIVARRSDAALLQAVEDHLVDPATFRDRVAELYRHPGLESRDEIRLKDGRVIDRYSAPVRGDDGTLYGRVWFFRDVTEQRQAEEGLARLAAIVESSDDAIISRTLEGTITTWNRGAERLYGFSASEVIGQDISRLLPPARQAELPSLTNRLARGEQIPHFETVRLRKDGTRVDVSISLSPIRDAAGRVVAVSTIARDITERTRAEAGQRFLSEASTLLASSLDYEATLARVAQLAVPHLADWCIVYRQQEDGSISRLAMAHADPSRAAVARDIGERFVIDPDAAAGIPHILRAGEAVLHPEVSPAVLAADVDRPAELATILAGLHVRSWMGVPLAARGRTFGAISFVAAESGRRYSAIDLALAEDLGRRAALAIDNARLYQDAQEALRRRDEFLSIAAHELRNPVMVLKGATDLLRRSPPDPLGAAERQERLLRQIAKAADRLAALTDDLLDISRIQLGQLPLRSERLDLNAFVHDLGTRYREQLDTLHHLAIVAPGRPCFVLADTSRLEQVLVNLLDNAGKYSPGGGLIELAVRPDDTGVLISVRDEGIGLPPGAEEAIFEPFGRAGNTGGIPGMGLGLFICRNIVERHG
ncbi:MAG: PAS domain S-box protein, partial [Chloroflexi bacterium]|nr:PAS domain S-box protein [Chloroflexota bacterium]